MSQAPEAGSLCGSCPGATDIMLSWCAASSAYCVLNSAACMWQRSSVSLMTRVHRRATTLHYYKGPCFSCFGAASQSIYIPVGTWHIVVMAEMWLFVSLFVCVTVCVCLCFCVCVSQWWQDHHGDRPGFWSGAECHHAGAGNWTNGE